MTIWATVASSATVAALVGALAGYLSQRSLAERQASVNYTYNARLRLYESIGPLRYQLLLACRDVYWRVNLHTERHTFDMDPTASFVRSFIYRLLRPLAIGILIERQTTYADFAVDRDARKLLAYDVAAYRILTGIEPLPYYTGMDWDNQTQHLARDSLRDAAAELLTKDPSDPTRTIVGDYSWFSKTIPDPSANEHIAPLAEIFRAAQASVTQHGVFWVRLVGYGYLCERFIDQHANTLGARTEGIRVRELLALTSDQQVSDHLHRYPAIFDSIITKDL